MRVQGQDLTFDVFNAMKFSIDEEECLKVELVDFVVTSELDQMLRTDALERAFIVESDSEDEEGQSSCMDYVSKWVEVKALPTNDAKVVINFLHKQIFTRFAYHPQTNGQAEVFNREIKRILEKVMIPSGKDWSLKLEEAVWAYRTTFKTPLGMSSFQMVYDKACHLPAELNHKAYWALKKLNLDMAAAGEKKMLQLNELDEFRLQAYENNKLYKEKIKRWHDRRLVHKSFFPGQQVLLFNTCLRFFPGKFKSRWSGPFIVKIVFPH
ncbi:uncharacterized protein LOC141691064 [Apium graveolens]|uniref:uncharacterized protein LOC141691064 n=1 Tax=Apium graveolens TaxID=4045 RepID=UPI003D79D044